jgi:hypothetical protein
MNILMIGEAPRLRALGALFESLVGCRVRWLGGSPPAEESGYRPDLVLCEDSPGTDGSAQVARALREHGQASVALVYHLPERKPVTQSQAAHASAPGGLRGGVVLEFHRPCTPTGG